MKKTIRNSSIGIAITFGICIYSANHPERYHVLVPVMFGTICLLLIALLIITMKEK